MCFTLNFGANTAAVAVSQSPESTYVLSEVSSFVAAQAAIRNELRDGVNRLQSVCKKKAQSGGAKLSDLQQDTSQRLLQTKQRTNEAERAAETAVKRYLDEAKTRRSEKCNALSGLFKEKGDRAPSAATCQQAEAEFKNAESLNLRLSEYKEISRSRQELFQELLQTEARGCTRPGFTEQLFGVYQTNNLGTDLGIAEYFTRVIDKLRVTQISPAGVEK